jgi:DHA2 family multidrug resistance protein
VNPQVALSRGERNLIAGAAIMASALQTLDMTIANTALPAIQGSLAATQDQIAWVLTFYAVAGAIMTPPTTWLAERFGYRRVFATSIATFTLLSVFCGLAGSVTQLAILRFLQGLSGAAIMPLSQATLMTIFPPEARARAFAMWMMGTLLGPILGPTVGGYVTEEYNWRWIFLMNIPFGVMAVLPILALMPERRPDVRPRFDATGFLLLSIAIGSLQLGLDRGHRNDWFESTETVIEAALCVTGLYLFVLHLRRTREPFLPRELFRNRTFITGVLLAALVSGLLMGTMMLAPALLQHVFDYPVTVAGLLTSPRGLGAVFATVIVARYGARLDGRILLTAGILLIALSLWYSMHFSLNTTPEIFIATSVLQGVGMALMFGTLQIMSFNALSVPMQTHGATLFSLGRYLGGSVGMSLMTTLLARNTQQMHERLREHVSVFDDPSTMLPQAWDWSSAPGAALLDHEITRQAMLIAYLNDFAILMWVTLAALPFVLLMRAAKRPPPGAERGASIPIVAD